MTKEPPEAGPLVSVVLPTRNRADLLPRAIRSVLAQTYSNLELIVVDDASTDSTPDCVGAFPDPRLRYHRLAGNRGGAAARNVGIGAARGQLLAFQDDDDLWRIEKLEKQVAHLIAAGPETALCLCGLLEMYPQYARYCGGQDDFSRLRFDRGIPFGPALIATPTWLGWREPLEAAGLFDERLSAWDDWEFALRISQRHRIAHLPDPLVVQDHTRGGGIWRNNVERVRCMKLIVEKHGALWSGRPELQAKHHFLIGRTECMIGAHASGRRRLWNAIRLRPSDAKSWMYLAASLTGGAGFEFLWRLRRKFTT
ncbi:MAG: glycosyltransferase family 2 protein [Gammaproteobacteria bacterium]|nr:glycosyltransferase family 2 protein [Gammaproteobacteria bacterium]